MSYEKSHIARGPVYDETIESDPFDNYMARLEPQLIEKITKNLFAGQLRAYMDFACGTGRITQTIAPLAQQSYGVDISESMVTEARKKCPDTTFKIGDYTQEQLDIEPVNLVTMFRFLGNAEDNLRQNALKTVNNALEVGGFLIINNHRNPNALLNIFHRLSGGECSMDLSHSHLKKLLHTAGFEVVSTHCIGLWVFKHGLCKEGILNSKLGALLESYLWIPGGVNISPDAIILAKKVRTI